MVAAKGNGRTCIVCGDRIGVYQRIYVDLGRGRLVRSSLLALRAEERRSARAFWHEHHGGEQAPDVPPAA
jgi:hypothetical protein